MHISILSYKFINHDTFEILTQNVNKNIFNPTFRNLESHCVCVTIIKNRGLGKNRNLCFMFWNLKSLTFRETHKYILTHTLLNIQVEFHHSKYCYLNVCFYGWALNNRFLYSTLEKTFSHSQHSLATYNSLSMFKDYCAFPYEPLVSL